MAKRDEYAFGLGRADIQVIARLRVENEELREQVRQLTDALAATDVAISRAWKLTASETTVYRDLARKPVMRTKAQTHFALYGFGEDDPDLKIVDVLVCKLRAKIEPFGGKIETVWGQGYRLAAKPAMPVGLFQAAPEPDSDVEPMVTAISEIAGRACGVSRLFVTIVRCLAASPGKIVGSNELADALYDGFKRPTYVPATISSAVRRGKHTLSPHGWEIAATAGHGGGYVLRRVCQRRDA